MSTQEMEEAMQEPQLLHQDPLDYRKTVGISLTFRELGRLQAEAAAQKPRIAFSNYLRKLLGCDVVKIGRPHTKAHQLRRLLFELENGPRGRDVEELRKLINGIRELDPGWLPHPQAWYLQKINVRPTKPAKRRGMIKTRG